MSNLLKNYIKEKDYLFCFDSDGTAIDSMDIKHFKCFGPCMIEEWNLGEWQEEIQNSWNDVNLYTMTRGINRFKGLAIALQEINEKYTPVEDIKQYLDWVDTTKELSNKSLEKEIERTGSFCLKKALHWSVAVNERINELPDESKKPFDGVKEALEKVKEVADIAIVSSANRNAVIQEWEMYDLLPYANIILTQDVGTKEYCINQLLEKGYDNSKVILVGDAPGDLSAAEVNKVLYYPILVKKEADSWTKFREEAIGHVIAGTYAGKYQENMIQKFLENLSNN